MVDRDREEWVEAAGFVFQTRVRSKRPPRERSPAHHREALLARVTRVTRRFPEVMVKVTGSARGFKSLKEHLAYITRNGKLEAERANGEHIEGSRNVKSVAEDWWASSQRGRPKRARDTINLILSMPAGTDCGSVAAAAREFACENFGGRFDYMLAIHEDTDHPHAHVTVLTRGFDGRRLDPRKADLQAWRESFAEALRRHGVEAAATPRRSRGVVRKAIRQAVKHIDARGGSDARRQSRVTQWKLDHAIKTAASGSQSPPKSWELATRERQKKIRRAWLTIASGLEAAGQVALAIQVRQFVAGMPTIQTEREALLAKAKAILENQRVRGREAADRDAERG